MSDFPNMPRFLWDLFQRLRLRSFPLGPDDYEALRLALRAGFGWGSREALRDLCCALWAKSRREKEVVEALFAQLVPHDEDWTLPAGSSPLHGTAHSKPPPVPVEQERGVSEQEEPAVRIRPQPQRGLPPISLDGFAVPQRPFVFVPQFPLSYREVVQIWRRLRRPVRVGPPTELDVDETVGHRARSGMVSPPILRPRRRNVARLLLLVDRQGSMTPFHSFVDDVCRTIKEAATLQSVEICYFHDVPAEGGDETVLEPLAGELFPVLDPILAEIHPVVEGWVFDDPELLSPRALKQVLTSHALGAAVAIVSDAGAARGQYDLLRILDTVAFLKGLRAYSSHIVWLNPLPRRYWPNTTAAQIARHVPMFPLEREGIHQAVNVLRGQVHTVERPV